MNESRTARGLGMQIFLRGLIWTVCQDELLKDRY